MAADLAELFVTPPAAFVGARNALVKALKAAKRKDEAAAVAGLRRPTVQDWALNTVAAIRPKVVAEAVAAFERVGTAQGAAMSDGGGGDLRQAMGELRAAATALRTAAEQILRDAGRPATDHAPLAGRVNELLANRQLVDQLAAGRLGSAAVDEADPFAGLPDLPGDRRPTRPPTTPAPALRSVPVGTDGIPAGDGPTDGEPADDPAGAAEDGPAAPSAPAAVVPDRVAIARAERAERERKRAAEARDRERRRAERAVEQAETEVTLAARRFRLATAALEAAEREEAEAHRLLGEAERERDAAVEALAALDGPDV